MPWSGEKNICIIIYTMWGNLRAGGVGYDLIAQVPDHTQTEVEIISVINCGLSFGQEKIHNILVSHKG